MGSSLWSVMVNIIMIELENKIIKPFMNDGGIKFYCQYVNDKLLVMKPQDVRRIHKLLNGSDINLKFPGDLFKSEVPYFVDLEMPSDGI